MKKHELATAEFEREVLQRLTRVETQQEACREQGRRIEQRLEDMHTRMAPRSANGGLRNAMRDVGLGVALVTGTAAVLGLIATA